MKFRSLFLIILLSLGSFCSCSAAKPADRPDPARIAAATDSAEFKEMTSIIGRWSGSADGPEGRKPAEIVFKLTSGGSAIEESLFPGTPSEMISVYHQNLGVLQMTHYCMLANQPELRATLVSPGVLKLDFIGAANMKSENEMHMHSLEITIIDRDHLKETWTMFKDGKPLGTTVFNLTRKG